MIGRIRLGTQAWNYEAWTGPFYPAGTRSIDHLPVYARAFDTVEVDSTFYATPPVKTLRGWRSRVPQDFSFALKLPQEITHERGLRNAEDLLDEFTDRARELGPTLGPILIQLAPDFGPAELPAVARFLPRLPRDLRFTMELRHKGWFHEGMLALLGEHGVALTLSDGRWIDRKQVLALAERPTADFAYVRWMGPDRSLVDFSRIQVDRSRETERWAATLTALAGRGRDVYGYMSNHFAGHAPASTRELQRLVGQVPVQPEQMGEQISLF